ncbi:MAG: polysaccharide biosynthesis tyrosine autokinase [Planctomycetota bacterium]
MPNQAEPTFMYPPQAGPDPSTFGDAARQQETPNIPAAMWRYRWAVLLPAILGAAIGFVVFLQLDDTFRSTTRLIVESDRAPAMDAMTGELVGGVPSIEVVQSQLFSDQVLATAYSDARLQPFHNQFEEGFKDFVRLVITEEALELEPEFTDLKTAQSLVMLLHFDSNSEELSEAAVKAFSDALQSFYNTKHKSNRSALLTYMETATEKLYPQLREIESRYREFRKNAPLTWDANGTAINPHREHQLFLVQREAELTEELRRVATEHAAAKSIADSAKDPMVALAVIGQMLERRFSLPDLNLPRAGFGQDDETLAMVKMEENLIPLMVERNQFAAEFGAEHPTVRQLDIQIEGLRQELTELVKSETNRINELLDGSEKRVQEASEALEAILGGLNTQVAMLQSQIKALKNQIAEERIEAAELAEFELEHEGMLREIEQHRDLMNQVEEQMARVSLTEEESGTRVLELKQPSKAYLVSPILWKTSGIGTFLGLLMGAGLAFLLEKNANTFRDPEEIVEIVGAPVLTHVPFFKGRVRKGRKEKPNAFEALDPHLAVVHSPASVAAEALRSCRTSLFFETAGIEGGKLIQVTSPLPGDGKSTIAGNLACSIAQSGKRTIIVDCDLRRPQLTDNFALADNMGLTDVLDGRAELSDAAHSTPLSTLDVMPSGPIPANPAEALTLPEMGELLEVLREKYDYVVLDTPPLLLVTDPSIVASMADGVVLAVKIRRKSKPNSREATKILRSVGARVLGVVVNNSDEAGKSDGYKGYGYYRYGRQTSRYYRNGGAAAGRQIDPSERKDQAPLIVSGRSLRPGRVEAAVATNGSATNGYPAARDETELS